MTAKVHKTPLSRALMLLCCVAGFLMLASQGHKFVVKAPDPQPSPSLAPVAIPTVQSVPVVSSAVASEWKVVVDLNDRQVQLYQQQTLRARYPIAIGKEGWETPRGSFQVFQMYQNPVWEHPITGEKVPPGPRNPLGKWWIGFGVQGKLLIGFHGTPEESSIGQAVSHGCVRMRNEDIAALYRQIGIGTPVVVKSN